MGPFSMLNTIEALDACGAAPPRVETYLEWKFGVCARKTQMFSGAAKHSSGSTLLLPAE